MSGSEADDTCSSRAGRRGLDSDTHQGSRFSRRGLILGTPAALAASPAFAQVAAQSTGPGGVLERDVVRIAVPGFSSPPFFEGTDGNFRGLDADLSREIASGLEVAPVFDRTPASFDEAVERVAQGHADLAICKLSRTLHRGRIIRYSRPYTRLHHGLLTNRVRFARLAGRRETREVIRSFDGTLGVIRDSAFGEFARTNFPNAELRRFESWSDVIAAIRDEEIDAAYRDDFEIKRLLLEDPSLTVVAGSITLTDQTDTLAIGVRPDAGHLLDFVNLYFDLSGLEQPRSADKILSRLDAQRDA